MCYCLILLSLLFSTHAKEAKKSLLNSKKLINASSSAIEDIDGLKAALKSCSFENELVVISSSTSFADAAGEEWETK